MLKSQTNVRGLSFVESVLMGTVTAKEDVQPPQLQLTKQAEATGRRPTVSQCKGLAEPWYPRPTAISALLSRAGMATPSAVTDPRASTRDHPDEARGLLATHPSSQVWEVDTVDTKRFILPPKDSGISWGKLSHRVTMDSNTQDVLECIFIWLGDPEGGIKTAYIDVLHMPVNTKTFFFGSPREPPEGLQGGMGSSQSGCTLLWIRGVPAPVQTFTEEGRTQGAYPQEARTQRPFLGAPRPNLPNRVGPNIFKTSIFIFSDSWLLLRHATGLARYRPCQFRLRPRR